VRYPDFFNKNGVIIVTSLVLKIQSANVVFCPPLFLHNSPSVKQHCVLREKWTSSRANLFKRQT